MDDWLVHRDKLTLNKLCIWMVPQEAPLLDVAPKCRAEIHERHKCNPASEGIQ